MLSFTMGYLHDIGLLATILFRERPTLGFLSHQPAKTTLFEIVDRQTLPIFLLVSDKYKR